jgi:hypothetical protein
MTVDVGVPKTSNFSPTFQSNAELAKKRREHALARSVPDEHVRGVPETSTLYVLCPGCNERTLLVQPGVRCASCGYDYAQLASDPERLNAIVLGQLRAGGFHAVAGIELRRRVTGDGAKANAEAIKSMALAHGIDLTPKGLSFPVLLIGGMLIFGAMLMLVMKLWLG